MEGWKNGSQVYIRTFLPTYSRQAVIQFSIHPTSKPGNNIKTESHARNEARFVSSKNLHSLVFVEKESRRGYWPFR
jgi:hypothetical protein